MAIGLAWSKIVSMSVMFAVTMLFGAFAERLVWLLKRKGKGTDLGGSLIVHLLNCFAGGLFLGTFLLGLLPEVRELFEAVLERYGSTSHFPVAEACTAVGFFMVMFVEKLVEMCQGTGRKDIHLGHSHGTKLHAQESTTWHIHGHGHGHQQEWRLPHGVNRGLCEQEQSKPYERFHYVKENEERVESSLPVSTEDVEKLRSPLGMDFKTGENNRAFVVSGKENGSGPGTQRNELQICQPLSTVRRSASYPYVPKKTSETLGQDHMYETLALGSSSKPTPSVGINNNLSVNSEDSKSLSLRSLILVLALSMHTLFEGLALGLLDEEASVWTLMIAVTIHKSVIVMALSIQLCKVETNTVKTVYLHLFMFAVMSPVGIGVGTAVTESGNPDDLVTDTASSILQALATGTFLYVTFFEVLNRELEGSPDLRKVLAVIVGFCGIIGLKFLELQGGH